MGSCNAVHRRISKFCDTVSPFHRKRNLLFLNLQPFFQNRHRWYSKAHIPVRNPISYQPCRITKFCIITILYHHKPTSYNPLSYQSHIISILYHIKPTSYNPISYQSCIITNLHHINYITLTLKLSCRPGFVLGSLFQT